MRFLFHCIVVFTYTCSFTAFAKEKAKPSPFRTVEIESKCFHESREYNLVNDERKTVQAVGIRNNGKSTITTDFFEYLGVDEIFYSNEKKKDVWFYWGDIHFSYKTDIKPDQTHWFFLNNHIRGDKSYNIEKFEFKRVETAFTSRSTNPTICISVFTSELK